VPVGDPVDERVKMTTLIDRIAQFVKVDSTFEKLPVEVIDETKRILLDSFGCALAAVDEAGAQMGVAHGYRLGKGLPEASIWGSEERVSVYGAAFANAELINALDFDAVLPPGHVAPYVVPGAVAFAEQRGASGKELIAAIAAAHEISNRLGKAMTYQRDIKNGQPATPEVMGFSVTVFGATAAIASIQNFEQETIADALGITGSISPVNAQRAWVEHTPSTTVKYNLPGQIAQTAMTAASMAELGHTGDRHILDDAEFGFPRFIGSGRWAAETIGEDFGENWRFPAESTFKPYPHCRVMHSLMHALIDIVESNDIQPEEIESITAWGEAWVMLPVWENRDIRNARDAQFGMAHGLAVAAQRLTPGKDWADLDLIRDPAVLALMDKISVEKHPDWAAAITANPAARPARIELSARGKTFTAERTYPKGSPSPDPDTFFTNEELIAKFLHNAKDVISPEAAQQVVEATMNLENIEDINEITRLLAPAKSVASAG
jgi:2-methylcitrate dehydratase PrpD